MAAQGEKAAPTEDKPSPAPPKDAPAGHEKGSAGDGTGSGVGSGIAEADSQLLVGLLKVAGAEGAKLSKVERTVERQTRVMYDLARSDVEQAKAMYCDAGDAVIDAFDAQAGEVQNLARMQGVLEAQLPRARELGCLNHVENTEVYSVDIAFDSIPEAGREAFEAASRSAVKEGRAVRFLGPPRHPGAFHFEFRKADKKAEE